MPTVMQTIERLRGQGDIPGSGRASVRELLSRFSPASRGSVRTLQSQMLDRVSIKKPWAVILCRFRGEAPNPPVERPIEQLYRDMFTTGMGGMIEFWRDVSLGVIEMRDSAVFGWTEVSIARANANTGSGVTRGTLIDAAIAAAQRDGFDPLTGFHSQIAVYTENWSINNVPAGLDWSDPQWGSFWIDGSADGRGKVCLTPPHDGNICAHEIGHGLGMNHDLGSDLVTHYQDPCCILSQNNSFVHPRWMVPFGPALCLPHLVQQGWMFSRRLYSENSDWMRQPGGISLPLAPVTSPIERANLGIKLAFRNERTSWDYYLEYVQPRGWNEGLGKPFVFIRRMAPFDGAETTAILGQVEVPATRGDVAEFFEPAGRVRFSVERFDDDGHILKVHANAQS